MTDKRLRILILGGYGTFGGRLATLLSGDARLSLIIAGRSRQKAEQFIATLPVGAEYAPMVIDRNHDPEETFLKVAPDIVVDASGPFQSYGRDPYRVVRAAIATGANYLDLADGSVFVEGIAQFDAAAQEKGLFVLSGVSSFPVLTAAAVRALSRDMVEITSVAGGIAPSPYAGVGLNVIRAITHYAGQPIRLMRDGRITSAHALTETRHYTIAPPGRLPLKSTRFSLVDVPDLLLVPAADPRIKSIWMGAGPVPEVLHRLLNGLAWLVRLGVLPTIAPLARFCFAVINRVRWGEHRGGMFIELRGRRGDGGGVKRSWHLLAEGSDGPFIPSMAVDAIVRKVLAGTSPAAGARPATDALELSDYEEVFEGRTIFAGLRDETCERLLPLYPRVLGSAWMELPHTIRAMHETSQSTVADGVGCVDNGRSLFARLIRRLVGFPGAGGDLPVTVSFKRSDKGEEWTRTFAGHEFSSFQRVGEGRDERLLTERFGPAEFGLALVVDAGRLRFIIRRWRLFGVPLPLILAPRCNAFEAEHDGKFHFHVELSHPWVGLIVRYAGWLEPRPEGWEGPVEMTSDVER
ncbi:SDR family oxidoreductase [Devosia nitrariae]|uniref:DUF4166 domain-containing protein n=1 Tax=Devosia nitrariae TaxID=2071872 RepID=A0ABQ5WAK7_9HYPH|nr:SDR family oxidoreductase [Devosia nitrariae]GLQ57140.1 hypothetical protein GCM10010862_43990 [Devosia nitrariae]